MAASGKHGYLVDHAAVITRVCAIPARLRVLQRVAMRAVDLNTMF